MTDTRSETLIEKVMRTLAMNKFDYSYVQDFHYRLSSRKLCSTYISIDPKILSTCVPYLVHCA